MKFITSINDRIKDLRLERNLLQSDFEQIGISASTLSDYEKDGSTIPSYVIPKLAEFFGVTTDYLFGLTNIRQPENNSLNGIYFSDNAIEFLKRKDINTKLLSEMIEHPAHVENDISDHASPSVPKISAPAVSTFSAMR